MSAAPAKRQTTPRTGELSTEEACRRLAEAERAEQLLHAIIQGTAAATGTQFFRSLVKQLAEGLHVRFAFVAECLPSLRARSLAFFQDQNFGQDFEYALPGTPCMKVAEGRVCHVPDRLAEAFPEDTAMIALGTVSYLGVPVRGSDGTVLGHLVTFDDKPMPSDPLALSVMETFAARAGVELERMRMLEHLQALNSERQALLDVNRAVARHLERDELFGTLAECLRRLFEMDRFGIELPIEGNRLQGHLLSPNAARDAGPIPTRTKILNAHGTACNWVLQNNQWLATSSLADVRERFPITYDVMRHEGMESLCAIPLLSGDLPRGVMYFMSARPAAYTLLPRALLEQVAGTVAVALDDCLAHEELRDKSRRALAEREERLRDLFDEAPIAYVNEGLDSKFIRANKTALRTLGIQPEDVPHTYGKTFIPDTPEAQARVKAALESIGKGVDTRGVVLELRRKDNGEPLWIQWWSRPDPSGQYTRTMFIDITERVLMEQEKARLEAQNTYLQEEIRNENNFDEIVGSSSALMNVLRRVEQIARIDSTVLILGETGTGKELIARAIHDRSPRRSRPLVKVNCGAISAGLVESELFGHVKGAFTGAIANRDGRFKLADGGTIFLDEVGELPMDTQVKLLRVLQEQEFEPIGSSRTLKVNVRVVAATNRDLEELVREGKFRADLFYRLNVVPLRVPALRERAEDLPLLVTFFVQKLAAKLGKHIKSIGDDTMEQLTRYAWPGNVRELQNVIERAVILSPGSALVLAETLRAPVLPSSSVRRGDSRPGIRDPEPEPRSEGSRAFPTAPEANAGSLEAVERHHIEAILHRTNWMIEGERGAAKVLNLNPSTLRSRMQKLNIRRPARPSA
jgi:PAS domain S-box-containing protein